METMTRRASIGLLAGIALPGQSSPLRESIKDRLPREVPAGVAAIIERTLGQTPASLNTDWFGTCLMKGLLEWAPRGISEAGEFGRRWFQAHLNSSRPSPYSGPKSRTVSAGGIPITTYAGHFGLAFPCFELARQAGDERARRVSIEVADIILHRTARNRLGMVLHDDGAEFTIPDVAYFVVTPLMIAFTLDPLAGRAYRDQAVFQLRSFIDVFLSKDIGLAKTILFKEGLGKSYWTRATGWLLWAMLGVLRHLPPEDPQAAGFIRDLGVLAAGIAKAQDSSGGLRLFLTDRDSPLETTGTLMCAMGLHEAVRRQWISESFKSVADHAWSFVRSRLSPEGELTQVYTGWAVPAEQGIVDMDKHRMAWIPGFVLSAACELTTPYRS